MLIFVMPTGIATKLHSSTAGKNVIVAKSSSRDLLKITATSFIKRMISEMMETCEIEIRI